ncbi:MAG TPA: serine/threonine-protein kinase [Myxococcaceae bacterium]|jgi:tetratricopeptide (TPR) repeat protein/predicted Ser/Thr protein kinase
MCPSESLVLDFVEGALEGEEADAFHQHLDHCQSCQRLVAEVARAEASPEPKHGDRLDRFLIVGELGRGGMGVVYAAFDPQLDRKVALKLLRGDASQSHLTSSEQRGRLLKEAQALARLSHPHVVRVYEAREVGDQVFVVMELVEGHTLGEWLRERPRSWREVLEVFLKAGAGLQAAHRAGLVHRDFKPENVLIGKDGRVLVTDFGLARVESVDQTPATARAAAAARATVDLEGRPLTRTGALVGTPAFMAPEQWEGAPADARSDQFSFCVALHLGLYGFRPFDGVHTADLRRAVLSGQVPPAPRGSYVPRWVRRSLVRGLSVAPAARFSSMGEMLSALARNPLQRYRAPLAVAASLLLVASGAALGAFRANPAEQLCKGSEQKLAFAWDGSRKGAVREALLRGGSPFAQDAWTGVERTVGAYAASWVSMHRDACEATRVRRDQSETMLDLRVQCLERRARDLEALTNFFIHGGPEAVEGAVQAAYALPPLKECAEVDALAALVKPPSAGPQAALVGEVDRKLSEVRALAGANRFEPAIELAQGTAALSRTVDHAPTRAEAYFLLGLLRSRRGDGPAAEEALFEAALSAEVGHADRLAARARIELVIVVSELQSRLGSVDAAIREARAALGRFGADAELESRLESAVAVALTAQDKCEEALPHLRSALQLADRAYSRDDPRRGQILTNLGNSLRCTGDFEGARVRLEEAQSLYATALGPSHPEVALSLHAIANLLFTRHDYDGALSYHRSALQIRQRVLGPNSALAAQTLADVGVDLIAMKKNKEGREMVRRSLAIQEQALGANSPKLAHPLLVLGHVEAELGDPEEAVRVLERALGLLQGRDDDQLAVTRFNLALALSQVHRDERRARELATQAREYFSRRKDVRRFELESIDAFFAQDRPL